MSAQARPEAIDPEARRGAEPSQPTSSIAALPFLEPGALNGVRIVDFTWHVVGPWAPRLLAHHGAEVIKVERPDQYEATRSNPINPSPNQGPNESGTFNNTNVDKIAITLDVKHPRGQELIKQLIAKSDVVVENFSAGVLDSWGLGWEVLREINPRLVYVPLSGFGHAGPWKSYRSFGPTAQALSGLTLTSGLPGEPSAGWGFSYMDVMGGFFGGLALTMGLYHARRTGQGVYLDYSIVEAAMSLLGTYFLDFDVNGRSTRRADFPPGNRSLFPRVAPHNTYRVHGQDRLGQDQWCFIACETQQQFEALCAIVDREDLLIDERFSTNEARIEHEAELDAIISAWTLPRSRYEIMDLCQRAGIVAAVVQNAEDRVEYDPQLRARGVYPLSEHPVTGWHRYEGPTVKLSRTPPKLRRPGPLWREHNEYVFGVLLGLDPDEIAQLVVEGVI